MRQVRDLTKLQVAYLSQTFATPKAAQRWLKAALPREQRANAASLAEQLEAACRGERPPSAALALTLLARRQELDDLQQQLNAALVGHSDCAAASPALFVILEDDSAEIALLASLDLSQPTLVPEVQRVTLFHEDDGAKRIDGQVAFDHLRHCLGPAVRAIDANSQVFLLNPKALNLDKLRRTLQLRPVPLGFVVSGSEFA